MFLDRNRFAGQGSFLHLQIDRFEQAGVRRDAVAGVQENHVPRNQSSGRDFDFRSIAQDGGSGRSHLAQGFDGAFGAVFLHKAQPHGEQHDHGNDDRFNAMPEEQRNRRRAEQDQDEHILELLQQNFPG